MSTACFVTCVWLCFCGTVSAYGERPTVATIAYYQDLPSPMLPADVSGYTHIVTSNCGTIGWTGRMVDEFGRVHKVMVIDCGGSDGGHEWMIDNVIAVELGYYDWMRFPELVGTGAQVVVEVRPEWN